MDRRGRVPGAEGGTNRGGWSSPEYDRLLVAFNTTLDHGDRLLVLRRMLQILSEELPSVSLFFRAQPFAFVANLKGPAPAAPESNLAWNIHEWQLE